MPVPPTTAEPISSLPRATYTVRPSPPAPIRAAITTIDKASIKVWLMPAIIVFKAKGISILIKIEIPLSLKTIMAGINQTLMLALSMVVIAALIGAGGLGLTVYVALGRLDIGSAVIGGTGIVILAIILDRITQKLVSSKN